ncbi:MAG: polysaccharide deacetylase family protein, partial [Burkholderiaceae bacterium]
QQDALPVAANAAKLAVGNQEKMMLVVMFPDTCRTERCWISTILLGEFLGLAYDVRFDGEDKVRISTAGKTLELSDAFFTGTKDKWLFTQPLAAEPLQRWTLAESGLYPNLVEPTVPVLFGAAGFKVHGTGDATLNLDIFGSAFFMLTRYEEARSPERDTHERFPANASLAYRNNFLGRPIVDEYVEILWEVMQQLWPGLERKKRKSRTLISCDVDLPIDPACASLYRLGKRLLGRTWREKSFGAVPNTIKNYCEVSRGNDTHDPYHQAIFWMMDVNEKVGNQLTFNLIPEKTDQKMDHANTLDEPRMRTLIRTIHARGHLIGFHPGYNTYKHPIAFAQSIGTLRRVMAEENIKQEMLGGRQHYLRWEVMTTAQQWEANDMTYDSTLTYADLPGFRCGTCHEYSMYDLASRKPLKLQQRPLVVMESSVLEQPNMGLGHDIEALSLMQYYKRICHQFNGDFTLLWHNSYFEKKIYKAMYCEVIK